MPTLYYAAQYASTVLAVAGGINSTQTTGIVLQSIPSQVDVTKPGIVCLSWSNPLDVDKAEYITYTSINPTTKELQGVTRGKEGFSAKSHPNGATVAWVVSKSHINNINDSFTQEHNTDGTHSDITATSVSTDSVSTDTVTLTEQSSAPSTPASGKSVLYVKTDGFLYYKDSNGVERRWYPPIVDNNVGYQAKDSGGTAREVLKLNSGNVLEIGSSNLVGVKYNKAYSICSEQNSTTVTKNTTGASTIYTFSYTNLPAGFLRADVFIPFAVYGKPRGLIYITASPSFDSYLTNIGFHDIDFDVYSTEDGKYLFRSLFGAINNFNGGSLSINVVCSGENMNSSNYLVFGHSSDSRWRIKCFLTIF